MFEWFVLQVRRSLPIAFMLLAMFTISSWAQEGVTENPTTGTIEGTLKDEAGAPVPAARVFYSSSDTDTRGVTRTDKNGKYVTEQLPPGVYVVRAVGKNMLPVDRKVTVTVGGVPPPIWPAGRY